MYEYKITIYCDTCKEPHQIEDEYAFDTESDISEITCTCGAKIEVDYSVDVSISHTPPDSKEDKPAPNQLDLFTGKTIEGLSTQLNHEMQP